MPHSDLGALIGHHKPNSSNTLLHTRHSSERCETFKQCALCDLQQCATIATSERRETFKQCVLCEQSLASPRSSCAQTSFRARTSFQKMSQTVQIDLLSDCISLCHSWRLAALLLSFMLSPPWSAASDKQLLPVSPTSLVRVVSIPQRLRDGKFGHFLIRHGMAAAKHLRHLATLMCVCDVCGVNMSGVCACACDTVWSPGSPSCVDC